MRILFVGDIVGNNGLTYLEKNLNRIKSDNKANLVIVNGENITNGKGLSYNDYKRLMKLNIACITMGNHTYRCEEIIKYMDSSKIIRPLNIEHPNGKGYIDINYNGKKLTVVNLIGQNNMNLNLVTHNPYKLIENFLKTHKSDYTIVDFHAELTSEKIAMGYFLDGKVNAVLGTHTHVQTNDDRKLEKGTLYITDVGMTGPLDGVLGVKKEIIIDRLKDSGQMTFMIDEESKTQFNAVLLDFDKNKITKIHLEE